MQLTHFLNAGFKFYQALTVKNSEKARTRHFMEANDTCSNNQFQNMCEPLSNVTESASVTFVCVCISLHFQT